MANQSRVLFVDAYDSFSENIIALLRELFHAEVTSIKINSDIHSEYQQDQQSFFQTFDAIVLGPGPGNPNNSDDTGVFEAVWRCATVDSIPVLGVCLGFQSLCSTFGLSVKRMGMPCHGHPKDIHHAGQDIFCDMGRVVATNYNSLAVRFVPNDDDSLPSRPASSLSTYSQISTPSFRSENSSFTSSIGLTPRSLKQGPFHVLAWDDDGYLMAVKHELHPFWGFQFHPESCKSNDACSDVLRKWWTNVQTHNKLHRPPIAAMPQTLVSKTSNLTQASKSIAACMLVEHLRHLTSSIVTSVHSTTINQNFSRSQIANMCHQMSQDHSTIMLESTKKGRHSIYAFPDQSSWSLEFKDGVCTLSKGGLVIVEQHLGLQEMMKLIEELMTEKCILYGNKDIPFWGGFVGYLSYELGTDLLRLNIDDSVQNPRTFSDINLAWVDRTVVIDNYTKSATIQSLRPSDKGWIEEMITKLEHISNTPSVAFDKPTVSEILSKSRLHLPDHDSYVAQIQECQSELHAGNSYELCLTTEAQITTPSAPANSWHLYNKLQAHNPAPFAGYIDLNSTTILSSSPEQFLSWSRSVGTIDMVPMKGTVRKTPDTTLSDAIAILSTPKESAENLMIADLIRHDLYSTIGRSNSGSVEVVKICEVIEHETVYQLVSHIRAHMPLASSLTPTARQSEILSYGHKALRHTLPPGSMTGAPKKRSCEILSRLEKRNRGVYSGIIGFLDIGGGGSWNVCIRTAFSHKSEDKDGMQKWHVGAGGAITVLSDPEAEWEEMQTKLGSVLGAFRT